MLTKEQIRNIYPNSKIDYINSLYNQQEEIFENYKISKEQVPMLLAQIGHESAGLTILTENLNYSAEGLVKVWPNRFYNLTFASKFAKNPQKIANYVYANRMGNGPETSGDGWKYRGRGPIQITGKDCYNKISEIIKIDLVSNPDIVLDPNIMFKTVGGFWIWKNLPKVNDFKQMTRIINGGLNGYNERVEWLKKINKILHFVDNSEISIKEIQKKLNEALNLDLVEDGILGPKTLEAIRKYKKLNLLEDNSEITESLLHSLKLK